MRRYLYHIFLLAALIPLASCGERGKSKLPDTDKGVSQSNEAIEANIASLATDDWTAGKYDEIMDNQIAVSTEISDEDRMALAKKLNESYADQLLRCTDSVMDNACASSHAKLTSMKADLDSLSPKLENDYRKADIAAFNSRYAEHQKMLSFTVSSAYGLKVTPESSYNASYDRERKATAASYRAKSPKCEEIKRRISASYVESVLSKRRANFQSILERKRREAAAAL